MLDKARIVHDARMVGSSLGFASEWDKEEMRESLWDIAKYAHPMLLSFILHHVAITFVSVWVAWKLASPTIPINHEKPEDVPEILPSTEFPPPVRMKQMRAWRIKCNSSATNIACYLMIDVTLSLTRR